MWVYGRNQGPPEFWSFQKNWNAISSHFEYDHLYFCLWSGHLFWIFIVSVDFILAFSELCSFKISEQKFICPPGGHNKVCTWLSCSEGSVRGCLESLLGLFGFLSCVSCTWIVDVLICCGAAGADVWGEWECVCGSLPWSWSMTLLFSAPKQCSLCEHRGPSASSQHLLKCLHVVRLCKGLQNGKLLGSSQFFFFF